MVLYTEEQYNDLSMPQALRDQAQGSATTNAQQQYFQQEQERSIAEEQLDVDTIINKVYHLLRQDKLGDEDDKIVWQTIGEGDRTLTNWGVDKLMQIINFYVNKNNLLSNYNEEQINRIMLRFTTELNNLVLLKYELLFRQPTFEECKEILLERIDNKKKLRMFAIEILGKVPNEDEIQKGLYLEVEPQIEKEIQKIRETKRKEQIREYGILMAQLDAIVYATYNRSWKGEERGSLRRHINISEIIGKTMPQQQQKGGMFGWLKS